MQLVHCFASSGVSLSFDQYEMILLILTSECPFHMVLQLS